MARPILVERFSVRNSRTIPRWHAPLRAAADKVRQKVLAAQETKERIALLKGNKDAKFNETAWQLTPRPAETAAEKSKSVPQTTAPTKAAVASESYSIEATAQVAQVLTPPDKDADNKIYFEDLEPELQNVLRAQLQKPGDVSALVETPGAFLLFVAKEKSATELSVASFSLPKRSYDEWLSQQPA